MPREHRSFSQVSMIDLANDDVCTLVSIVPFLVSEFKPGIYPGRFVLPPCLNPDKPEILEVGTSVYFIPQFNGDEEMPAHVVKTHCKDMVKSIVNDYMSGQMDVTDECRPGFLSIPGRVTSKEFVSHHSGLLQQMKKSQNNWFGKLVQRADNDWNRYKNNKVVSDNQRFACRALGLEREWLMPDNQDIPVKCPMCFSSCHPEAIICAVCTNILKPEKYNPDNFAKTKKVA